jgi:hypothetical protein
MLFAELLPTCDALSFSYLSRNVALDGIGKLSTAIGTEAAVISLATLQKGAADKVPNVRFNAIKALRFVAPLLPPHDVASFVLPIMRNLATSDSDVDVSVELYTHQHLFCVSAAAAELPCGDAMFAHSFSSFCFQVQFFAADALAALT